MNVYSIDTCFRDRSESTLKDSLDRFDVEFVEFDEAVVDEIRSVGCFSFDENARKSPLLSGRAIIQKRIFSKLFYFFIFVARIPGNGRNTNKSCTDKQHRFCPQGLKLKN